MDTFTCDCCGVQVEAEINPMFRTIILNATIPLLPPCEVTVCSTCIQLLNIAKITTYVMKTGGN